MAGPTEDLEQLCLLWKHLETEGTTEIHQIVVQDLACQGGSPDSKATVKVLGAGVAFRTGRK